MPKEARGINEKTGLSGAEHRKAELRAVIDAQTSAAILAGFSYMVEGESLHFSYDTFDQQNFSDTANACLMYKTGAKGLPESVTWNAYKADGELVRLTFTADAFLTLYANALAHKAECMAAGGAEKAALEEGEQS